MSNKLFLLNAINKNKDATCLELQFWWIQVHWLSLLSILDVGIIIYFLCGIFYENIYNSNTVDSLKSDEFGTTTTTDF